MEPSGNGLNVDLETEFTEIEIETAVSNGDALDAHLEHVRSDAYEAGRRDQSAAAAVENDRINAQLRQQTSDVLQSLMKAVPDLLQQAENALKGLAVSVAKKYVADCPVDTDRIHALLKETLKKLREAHKIIVYLHPEDLALIEGETDQIKSQLSHPDAVSFRSSDELSRGGCRVETEFGQLDASVESKYQQINDLVVGPSLAA